MRVLLISNFAPDRQESMLRFSRQLAHGLAANDVEVATWAPSPRFTRLLPNYRYAGATKYVGYLDKFFVFPREIKRRLANSGSDVVHIIDHANAVYAPLFAETPLIATCHDLLQIRAARGELPEHRVASMGRRYQEWIAKHIAALPHVATPSTQTARELRRLLNFPAGRITVIPNGLNFPYSPLSSATARQIIEALLTERGLDPHLLHRDNRPFVLNVGGGQWYKNRRGLLEIYGALRPLLKPSPRLVMVGKPLSSELQEQAAALGIREDLLLLSGVSENELQAVYSTAAALIFPSWEEGFGWPIAEAQACGCPVFTSNREPMTEVGGAGAAYFDPASPLEAAKLIASTWPRRAELAARGRARATEWSPSLMIDRYLAAYANTIERRQPVAA
jgi:glycosyltransferase involved in cell wall biosynthesis